MRVFILLLLITLSLYGKAEKMVTLKSNLDGKNYDLKIDKMEINVKILENIAETTLDITFLNKLDKTIEGTLYLPMREGATLFKYQFEMNKKMKNGVVVEKKKARVAYESTVRKNIDPSLLVWTKGNNFKTRIYPIEANGTKRVIISYQEELKPQNYKMCKGKCPSFIYSFPLSLNYKLSSFKLKINGKNNITPLMKNKNRFISSNGNLSFVDENYIPNESIKLGIFRDNKSKILPIIKQSYNKKRKNWYFSATLFFEKYYKSKKRPKSLCIYWDSSSSMDKRDLKKEIEFFKRYKKYLGDINISFIDFSNDFKVTTHFANSKKSNSISNMIIKLMKDTTYDGGTQLGIIDTSKTPNNCKEALIFTDGVTNFGKSTPHLTIPTYFINSKLTAEHSLMKYLSDKTGASYINLQNMSVDDALKVIESAKFNFISAEFDNKEIREVWPSATTEVRDSFTVVGIFKNKNSKIKLNFGVGNRITQTITLDPSYRDKNSNILDINKTIERVFAKKKLEELLKLKEKNRSEIISISKKFSILTEFTSFLVLETLDDYLRYSIVPPKELQNKYFKIIENRKQENKNLKQEQLERILNKYNNFSSWWSQKHKTEDDVIIEKEEKIRIEIEEKELERIELEKEMIEDAKEIGGVFGFGISGVGSGGSGYSSRKMSRGRRYSRRARMMLSDSNLKGRKMVVKELIAKIELKEFDPNTPYLKKLKKVKRDHYKNYLILRENYKKSSSFYLDVSDFFFKRGDKKIALRILSNIVELELDNHELLRILAYRLWQIKENQLALYTLETVLEMRPEEPQSYRDIGLTYRNMKKYQKAIDFLYKVVSKGWDDRFSDIDLIALYEINSIIARVGESNLDLTQIDKRLIKNLPADIRVVLSWDANDTDIDLWVIDPYGEKCFYSHKRTRIGGYNTNDFTGGYGPEMFVLKDAHRGKYIIKADYYGSSSQKLSGEITIHAELFLNYGRKNQTKEDIVVRVKTKKQVVNLGSFNVGDKNKKLNGKIIIKYENNKKHYEYNFKNGKKDGKVIIWDKNGKKEFEYNFKDGKKDGKYLSWYENGNKRSEYNFKNGKKDGKVIIWYENGKKEFEYNFKNDIKDGKYLSWYENGKRESEIYFKNGKIDGKYLYWDKIGKKIFDGYFKDGKKDGKVIIWDNKNKKEYDFKNGELI